MNSRTYVSKILAPSSPLFLHKILYYVVEDKGLVFLGAMMKAIFLLNLVIFTLQTTVAFVVTSKGNRCTLPPSSRRMASKTSETADIFKPIKSFIESFSTPTKAKPGTEFDEPIAKALAILYNAAETKAEESDEVYNALVELERLQRSKRKVEVEASNDYSTAERMLQNLNGEWRLIFTTGTKETQNKLGGGRINYFPIKVCNSNCCFQFL